MDKDTGMGESFDYNHQSRGEDGGGADNRQASVEVYDYNHRSVCIES